MESLTIIQKPTERLFWEKYRPKEFEDVVLLPRISNILQHGIQTNLILAGPHGIGKTTLARILVKNYPHITLSSKLGVDKLRNEVQDFCSKMSINFDEVSDSNVKIVYLEEFDGATRQMQEELRAFIEEYEQHVRFIATCNHIQKIHAPILSRFNVIDFTPAGPAESSTLKREFLQYLMDLEQREQLGIDKFTLKEIVKKNFPDFRKTLQDVQIVHLTGSLETKTTTDADDGIYECIFSDMTSEAIWNYLYEHWLDRLDYGFEKFNRNFWYWVQDNHPDYSLKLPNYYVIISKYLDTHLPNARDPFVTLYAMIWELNQL